MSVIKLVIADENCCYTDALSRYLLLEHGQAFDIVCFTQQNALKDYFDRGEATDILLIDKGLVMDHTKTENIKMIIVLSEIANDNWPKAIYKYQKADKIVRQLIELYGRNLYDKGSMVKSIADSKVICVYSPSGTSAKTTTAYHLAWQYALNAKKVLFLSLEAYNSFEILEKDEPGRGVIFLLHLLKSKLPNLQLKLNSIKYIDESTNIHFVEREGNILEYKDLKMDDMELLLDFLRKQSGYDAIVLDMDSTINELVLGAFKYSDAIVNVLESNDASQLKYRDFLRQIPKINAWIEEELLSKIITVVNAGKTAEGLDSVDKSQGFGYIDIPIVEEYKNGQRSYFPEMTYFRQLYELSEKLCSLREIANDIM